MVVTKHLLFETVFSNRDDKGWVIFNGCIFLLDIPTRFFSFELLKNVNYNVPWIIVVNVSSPAGNYSLLLATLTSPDEGNVILQFLYSMTCNKKWLPRRLAPCMLIIFGNRGSSIVANVYRQRQRYPKKFVKREYTTRGTPPTSAYLQRRTAVSEWSRGRKATEGRQRTRFQNSSVSSITHGREVDTRSKVVPYRYLNQDSS